MVTRTNPSKSMPRRATNPDGTLRKRGSDECPHCGGNVADPSRPPALSPAVAEMLGLISGAAGMFATGFGAWPRVLPRVAKAIPNRPAVQLVLGVPLVGLAAAAGGGLAAGGVPRVARLGIATFQTAEDAAAGKTRLKK